MCAKAVNSYALLNITAKGSPLAEIYTKGCFLKVRNFKKTLSLVLSVLMLVSCCSVLFATFASAYTTNDGASANYGVYTYDFVTKNANGNAIDTYPSQAHDVLNAGNYNWSGGTKIDAENPAQSYISVSGEKKGLHMTSSYKAGTTTVGASNYMSKTFLRDPDSAISLTNDVNTGCYLVMKKGVTYTFVVKYKVEDITEGNTGIIGIGMFDYANTVSATAGTGGTVQVIGFSEARSSVDSEWQYYTVTVNADELKFNSAGPADDEMYVILTASSETKYSSAKGDPSKGYVTFHVDSVTVAAIDNKYTGVYAPVDDTTEDGSLTENVKIGAATNKIDFLGADGKSDYPTNGAINHNLLSCGSGAGITITGNRADYTGVSYVDGTGMHIAGYSALNSWSRNWSNRAFILDSDSNLTKSSKAANGANFLTLKDGMTYTFTLKYKLKSLDAAYEIGKLDGTKAAASNPAKGAYIGLGYYDQKTADTSISNTAGASGMTKPFAGGWSKLETAKHTEWQYLTVIVRADDCTFTDAATTLSDKYVMLMVASSGGSGEPLVMFDVESITVTAIPDEDYEKFEIYDDTTADGSLTDKAKVEYTGFKEYNFDTETFGKVAKNLRTQGTNDAALFYNQADAFAGAVNHNITANSDGSFKMTINSHLHRMVFFTGKGRSYAAYPNAIFMKENHRYYAEVEFSYTNNSTSDVWVYFSYGHGANITQFTYGDVRVLTTANGVDVAPADLVIKPGESYNNHKYKVEFTVNEGAAAAGKPLYITIRPATASVNIGEVTVHSAKVTVVPTNADTILVDNSGDDKEFILATNKQGMTLPRPADENGKYGSYWVDADKNEVPTIPSTLGIHNIYPVYKNHSIDFDSGKGYYAPGNRFGGGWSQSAKISADPLDATNNTLHFYNYMWDSKTVEGEKKYYYSGTNTANVSLTDAIDGQSGIKVKPNTTYTFNFKYYVKSLTEGFEKNTVLDIYQANDNGIGKDGGKTVISGQIFKFNETTDGWVDASITFTTLDEETTAKYPYILFKPVGGKGALSDNLYDSKTDAAALAEVDTLTNIYFDDVEFFETVTENAAADSYASIREEIAANEQTSALRVSAAISEAAADAASEIGFIALPTKKATADWYKFDAEGKLANGALSVKVKDVNGLGITGHEDITELLAPTTVPVADGQKAYQVSITGLQAIGKTGAGLRNDAISVVLYTKDAEGNYTYYFANEVSYDQTMTMYAMGGKDIAKYEY